MAKKVQSVDFLNAEDPTCVNVPYEIGNAFDHIVTNYVNVSSTNNTSDTSRPCAVCDKNGHTFDDCPVLKNVVDILCKHYIQFKLFLKKQLAATATINHVQIDKDNDYDSIDCPFNGNTPTEDFQEGWE